MYLYFPYGRAPFSEVVGAYLILKETLSYALIHGEYAHATTFTEPLRYL